MVEMSAEFMRISGYNSCLRNFHCSPGPLLLFSNRFITVRGSVHHQFSASELFGDIRLSSKQSSPPSMQEQKRKKLSVVAMSTSNEEDREAHSIWGHRSMPKSESGRQHLMVGIDTLKCSLAVHFWIALPKSKELY
ncbi:PREDICTED: uncharacterized protein LOC104611987 [Nelumbo nucifera]|uniref:Uncharacterized protein LOC104611987 n=1 Tax=Nelumbo nucifera TaxID=4432 RepID=A0A1U8B8Y7_NELNU|nr:PREDICTED: uncharacterized protein LOC104611987 [Nelumbo nucifera]